MSDEVEYYYKRGQGWIVNPYTRAIKEPWISLYPRNPEYKYPAWCEGFQKLGNVRGIALKPGDVIPNGMGVYIIESKTSYTNLYRDGNTDLVEDSQFNDTWEWECVVRP